MTWTCPLYFFSNYICILLHILLQSGDISCFLVQDGLLLRTWHIFNLMTTIVLKECVLQLNRCFFSWVRPPPFKHSIWSWPFPKWYKNICFQNIWTVYFSALATSPSHILMYLIGDEDYMISYVHIYIYIYSNIITDVDVFFHICNQLQSSP